MAAAGMLDVQTSGYFALGTTTNAVTNNYVLGQMQAINSFGGRVGRVAAMAGLWGEKRAIFPYFNGGWTFIPRGIG